MKDETLKGYIIVWYKEVEINNILSFIIIREKYPIRYDTKGNYFVVVNTDREIIFRQSLAGLSFYEISNCEVVLINTVKESWESSIQSQYKGAKQVQWTLDMVGYLNDKDFNNTVCVSMITNCLVTFEYIKSAHTIFGPDFPSLKVKITDQKPNPVIYKYVKIYHNIL